MASNILKPIGFVLILGAVAAGAYFYGKSSGDAKQTNSGAKPDVVQQVKELVVGAPATEPAPAPGPGDVLPPPAPTPPKPTKPTAVRPAPTPAKPAPAPAPGPVAMPAVADAVPTTVTALSGDTVLTKAKARVRLLGIKTPESGTDSAHAREALAQLLGDGAVKIQLTGDRTAALVWKDGRLLNESMVRLGWSRSGVSNFMTAEAEAKRNRDGLWSPEGWMGP